MDPEIVAVPSEETPSQCLNVKTNDMQLAEHRVRKLIFFFVFLYSYEVLKCLNPLRKPQLRSKLVKKHAMAQLFLVLMF